MLGRSLPRLVDPVVANLMTYLRSSRRVDAILMNSGSWSCNSSLGRQLELSGLRMRA
jgi:hypothetical protein